MICTNVLPTILVLPGLPWGFHLRFGPTASIVTPWLTSERLSSAQPLDKKWVWRLIQIPNGGL